MEIKTLFVKGNQLWKKRKTTGNKGHNKGIKFTEEHKRKISESKKGKPRSEETKNKLSNSKLGKPIPHLKIYQFKKGHKPSNFIDGTSRSRQYQFEEWKKIARYVYQRDNYTCQTCGKKGGLLNAHHKIPWAISKNDNPNNLITLCVECHAKIHAKNRDEKGRWKNV
jgi:hypothetical protein